MSRHAEAAADVLPLPPVAMHAPAGGRRRHVLSILDLEPEEVLYLSRRAIRLKQAPETPQIRSL